MKNIVILLIVVATFSFGQSIFKKVDDATNSGVTEVSITERPDGFIIRHVKEDVVFNEEGKVVNEEGVIKLIRLAVKFDFDKYDLKDEFKDEIDEAVEFLNKYKTLNVLVEGHTDSIGTHEYNYVLSKARANKIASVLQNQGVEKNRIRVVGLGETVPVASNDDEDGRAQNRRVDISFNKGN